MSKEDKKGFHFVHVTEEDRKRELEETISNLTEEKKSDINFEGEDFYEIGSGHDFVYGWFNSYVTKSGVEATGYLGFWRIGGDEYERKDDKFIKIPKEEYEPVDFSDATFPVVKNVQAKTLGEDIVPIKPKK